MFWFFLPHVSYRYPKDWSWKWRSAPHQIWADGARRRAPPPPRARQPACSWSPRERCPYGSSRRARGPVWAAAAGGGGKTGLSPFRHWPPAPPGWAERGLRLGEIRFLHRKEELTLMLWHNYNPALFFKAAMTDIKTNRKNCVLSAHRGNNLCSWQYQVPDNITCWKKKKKSNFQKENSYKKYETA